MFSAAMNSWAWTPAIAPWTALTEPIRMKPRRSGASQPIGKTWALKTWL
jgi:hypothetical protein